MLTRNSIGSGRDGRKSSNFPEIPAVSRTDPDILPLPVRLCHILLLLLRSQTQTIFLFHRRQDVQEHPDHNGQNVEIAASDPEPQVEVPRAQALLYRFQLPLRLQVLKP